MKKGFDSKKLFKKKKNVGQQKHIGCIYSDGHNYLDSVSDLKFLMDNRNLTIGQINPWVHSF